MEILVPYLIIINAFSFAIMLVDKALAIKKAWRLPESLLMTLAAAGGSLGVLLGMLLSRHKTRKSKFILGIPLLLLLHILLFTLLRSYLL
jgi:uncharacterized membrane protein YsdA (DUF1294 family)